MITASKWNDVEKHPFIQAWGQFSHRNIIHFLKLERVAMKV